MSSEKQSWALIGLIVLSTLVVVGISIYLSRDKNTYEYNGFEVTQIKLNKYAGYVTKVYINQHKEPTFMNTRYDPRSLEDIKTEDVKDEIINKSQIYITLNPYANLTGITTQAALEINNLVEFFYLIPVNSAFTEAYGNHTVKTCKDANEETAVIRLGLGGENKIYKNKDCIILEAISEEDLIRAADRLVFHLLGVMK